MPLLRPPTGPGAGPLATVRVDPAPTARDAVADDLTAVAARTLADVRAGLALIAADPTARQLLSAASPAPDPDGQLAGWLYGRWWCGLTESEASQGGDAEGGDAEGGGAGLSRPVPTPAAAALGAARLEAARRTVAPTSEQWLVLAAAGDALVAASLVAPDRRRLRTVVEAATASSRPGCPPRPGDRVTLQLGSAGLDPTGSWWWAHAGQPEDTADTPLDRWYLHVPDLAAAAGAVPVLLGLAAEVGCALSLKCPPVAAGYGRRDALVAYLPSEAAPVAESALRRRADRLRPLLVADVPPCTRRLLPGVATAQDPGAPDAGSEPVSYGQLRCGQLAAVAARFGDRRPSDGELTGALTGCGIDVTAVERVDR